MTDTHETEPVETMLSDRSGILIVRLWMEGKDRDGLRARITQTLDSEGQEPLMATAGDAEGIYTAVRTWVEGFVDQG